jgi:hypothetical protein
MKRSPVVFLTVAGWTVGCIVYGYYRVSSILADPAQYDYEGIRVLPLMGFLVYRVPFLFIGLIVLITLELSLIPARHES